MEPAAATAMTEPLAQEQAIPQVPPPTEEPSASAVVAEVAATPSMEPAAATAMTEPLAQEQAIPQVRANGMEPSTTEAVHDVSSYVPESVASQIATPAKIPETIQTPLAPITNPPAPPVPTPQPPPGTIHTTVDLTFSFEAPPAQLTPALQLDPS